MPQRNVTSKNPPTQKRQIDVSRGRLGMDASPKRKVVLLVIYLFNYDSCKSTYFMLNMVFDIRCCYIHSLELNNLGQKVGDKLTKLSRVGFSMECFTAAYL